MAGVAVGGAVGTKGVSSGNVAQGAIGYAMMGASIGAVAGPIGAVVGAVVGAAYGAFAGNQEKKKMEKEKEAAEAAAAEQAKQLEEQKKKAAELVQMQISNNLGGGLATPELAAEVGELFTGGVTPGDIDRMGINAQDVLAREGEIRGQGITNNVNVGSPNINVSIGSVASHYDIQNLAQDLGYHLSSAIHDAAGSNG
jgi:hypothetical protein